MAEGAPRPDRLDPEVLAYSVVVREDVRLSAGGDRLTFTRYRARPDGSSHPETVLVDGIDSRPRARLLARRSLLSRWSPDDRRIAMVRSGDGRTRLEVRGVTDGATTTSIGGVFDAIHDIAWSPDGTRLALLAIPARLGESDIAGSRSVGLAIVDAVGDTTAWLSVSGEAAAIAWSPDGATLVARVRDPDGYVAWLELIEVDSGSTTAKVGGPTSRILGMTWTRDGTSLVVLGAPEFTFHPGLLRYDLASARLTDLIDEPVPHVVDIGGWLDEDRLLVHGRERARSGLYVLDVVHGDLERRIDLDGRAWGLATDATARRFATIRDTATEPPAVIVGDIATGTWSRVPDVARSLDDLGPATRPAPVAVPARDVTLDAWILKARGTGTTVDAAARNPAVLIVHGGPHEDLGDEWDVGLGQLLADHGFVVAWTNPRGSTSYGRAFTDAVRGDVGGPDLDDLLAVTDFLARRADVDGDRIGICGYSHGGFLAAAAITRTRRFAAAVCWAPFTDLLSEWGMSHEGRGWGRWVVGRDPTRDPDHYRERSPAWHVDGPLAPTLLIHGEQDDRTPIGQSSLFHELLALAGTTTRLVRIPDAGHALFERPAWTALIARETLDWFASHLRPREAVA